MNVEQLIIVDVIAYYRKVNIGTTTIVALRPRAEDEHSLDVGMTPEDILQLFYYRVAESELHCC
jgi:hypothetical protein